MKNLKKFNEDFESESLGESIHHYFLDISENPDYIMTFKDKGPSYLTDFKNLPDENVLISFSLKPLNVSGNPHISYKELSFDKIRLRGNKFLELVDDIDIAIKRLRDDYKKIQNVTVSLNSKNEILVYIEV